MPADFAVVAAQAQIINDKGSVMLQAVQLFNTAKVSDLDLTAGQKTMVKTRFTDALAAVKAACAIIDAELAS